MWNSKLGTLAAAAVVVAGCGSQGNGVRVAASRAAITQEGGSASTVAPAPQSFQSSDGATFTLSAAQANFRHIEIDLPEGEKCADLVLEAPAECKNTGTSGSPTIAIPGPIVVDLVTGASTPDLSRVRIPAGVYKRIDFRLDDVKEGEGIAETAPLFANSLVASASFEHEGQPAEMRLALKFNEDLRIEKPEGITLNGDQGELLLLLSPESWLSTVPVADCLAKGDVAVQNGVLSLDDTASGGCSGVENTIKENLKRSMNLEKSE